MKTSIKEILLILVLTIIIPGFLLNGVRLIQDGEGEPDPIPEIIVTASAPQSETAHTVSVLTEDGTVVLMELEKYLVGVVLGEMPAEFQTEALKAQAVVARTYTLRMKERSAKHLNADVCVKAECCQGYSNETSGASYERISSAVAETAGLVLTYEGELIEATYFSSSGGRTEDAVAVWGTDVPYLQSIESPEGEYAQKHTETITMSIEDFLDALDVEMPSVAGELIGEVQYTAGGGVDTMVINHVTFRGTELRKLLGLRSTVFEIAIEGDTVAITSRGYGHRVGMSQYGAEAMAAEGAAFQEILAHYYPGTTLEEFVDKESPIS